jgi:hypothetical protein
MKKNEIVQNLVNLRASVREHWAIISVLGLSLILNTVGITWGLPNYVDWAPDTIAPYDVLLAANHRFSNGWWDVYPPLHYMLIAIPYALLLGGLVLTGGFKNPTTVFPFGLADPLFALTFMILIARIVSVLMGVAIVWIAYRTVRELFDRSAALFAALIITLFHPLAYYTHNANVDVPYLFWAFLAIYHYVRILKYGYLKNYVLFALFATLSICTKDQAYGLFLLSPLPILWLRGTEEQNVPWGPRKTLGLLLDKRLLIAGAVAAITFVLAQNLPFNFSGFVKHVAFITGKGWKDYTVHDPTWLGRLQLIGDMISALFTGLTPPIFVACVAGSLYCAFKYPRNSLPVLFLAVSFYLTFNTVAVRAEYRFGLPIGMIIAFFGGKLLSAVWYTKSWQMLSRVAVCAILVYEGLFVIQLDTLFLTESRYDAEQYIRTHFAEGALVETFTPHHFHKYYPRFPLSLKVRGSRLAAGTQWEVMTTTPDKIFLPNLYQKPGAPDYIMLSDAWYGRFLRDRDGSEEAGFLRELFEGQAGYRLIKTFKTPTILPIYLPLNPTIIIFSADRAGSSPLGP